ncbi:hypothetical protein [Xanthomonas oryzae]|uniref:hypothetical protein n=1 Tax=Xanthomonas oryzae TaxID=347 RepID=UPI0015EF1A2F|nr:hypothetical protein [Xanthomonas oryzae]
MRDLEHECHLIPQAGGDCLAAINFYEDARELLERSFLPTAASTLIGNTNACEVVQAT